MIVLFVMGCGAGSGCDLNSVEPGEIAAETDGTPWRSSVTWTSAGESLQLNADPADGWWLSAVAQQTTDGRGLAEALSALPAEVDLSDGGWALLYTEEDSDRSASGLLSFSREDGEELLGCLDVETESGQRVTGAFSATPLN